MGIRENLIAKYAEIVADECALRWKRKALARRMSDEMVDQAHLRGLEIAGDRLRGEVISNGPNVVPGTQESRKPAH